MVITLSTGTCRVLCIALLHRPCAILFSVEPGIFLNMAYFLFYMYLLFIKIIVQHVMKLQSISWQFYVPLAHQSVYIYFCYNILQYINYNSLINTFLYCNHMQWTEAKSFTWIMKYASSTITWQLLQSDSWECWAHEQNPSQTMLAWKHQFLWENMTLVPIGNNKIFTWMLFYCTVQL